MIIALQYYEKDLEPTMSLARLLADLEPAFRRDALLALVNQPGTPRPELVARTVAHCRRRFPVAEVTSEFAGSGHPEGCTALWRGTAHHFHRQWKNDAQYYEYEPPREHANSILMLDGGDGVPLHRDWLDRMAGIHLDTLLMRGKLITGTPYFMGTCPLHVNPNAVFEASVFDETRFLDEMPPYDGTVLTNFDVYHREEMLAHASLSSVVRTDWRGGGRPATLELLRERSRESLWLHGYKDEGLHWLAREHVASCPPPPQIRYYELEQLRVQERVRRNLEVAGK
jgi:hypothetical protein